MRAVGYILKEAPHETLLRAMVKVAAEETFVDPGLIAEFVAGQGQADILTAREREDPAVARGRDVERRRRAGSSSSARRP